MSSACRPTLRTRLLGAELRRRRRRSGLSAADVERCIGARPGEIGELEAGRGAHQWFHRTRASDNDRSATLKSVPTV
jgi:hypothetical protein